jgi:hypothetical protein
VIRDVTINRERVYVDIIGLDAVTEDSMKFYNCRPKNIKETRDLNRV